MLLLCLKLFISFGNLFLNAIDGLFRQMCIQSLCFSGHCIKLALPITDWVQNVLFREITVIQSICYYSKILLPRRINYNSDWESKAREEKQPKGRSLLVSCSENDVYNWIQSRLRREDGASQSLELLRTNCKQHWVGKKDALIKVCSLSLSILTISAWSSLHLFARSEWHLSIG